MSVGRLMKACWLITMTAVRRVSLTTRECWRLAVCRVSQVTSFLAFLKKDNPGRFLSGRTYCVSGHALPENVVVFENVSALEPLWTLLQPGQKAIRRFARPRAITVDQSVTSKVI